MHFIDVWIAALYVKKCRARDAEAAVLEVSFALGFVLHIYVYCFFAPIVWSLDLQERIGYAKYAPVVILIITAAYGWSRRTQILRTFELRSGPEWLWREGAPAYWATGVAGLVGVGILFIEGLLLLPHD